jgi:hypothetical protein
MPPETGTGNRPHSSIRFLSRTCYYKTSKNARRKTSYCVKKIVRIVFQNYILAQQVSSIYETPSDKLKKSPIMSILNKAITTYWFTKHLNNHKEEDKF